MYRLLIVDDEAIIADGLTEVFRNLKEIELDVYEAYSATKALELLRTTRMDIVLTDIKMPGMDGLQLMDKIIENWPACRIIFLTGFNEFDYVYQAIKHEGVSYYLKTEGYDKIIEAVCKAAREIDRRLKDEDMLSHAKECLDAMTKSMQNDYFLKMLNGALLPEDITEIQFNKLKAGLSVKEPVLLVAGKTNILHKNVTYSEKMQLLCSIDLMLREYLASCAKTLFVNDGTNLVWFFQPELKKERTEEETKTVWNRLAVLVKGSLEAVQDACKSSFGIGISFAIDDKKARWESVTDRFDILKMLLNYRIGKEEGMLITDRSIEESERDGLTGEIKEGFKIRQHQLQLLEEYLDHGRKEEYRELFELLVRDLRVVKSIHDMRAQELYYNIALLLLRYINRWNMVEKIAFQTGLYKLMEITNHDNFSQAVAYLWEISEILFLISDCRSEKRAMNAIGRVQEYINAHLKEDLSLIRLADLVFFNPSYLSRLFKQINGENLSDYICEARVKKAEQLLSETDMKIYSISEEVGFASPANFGRFFKKLTNMTPQEYRDRNI